MVRARHNPRKGSLMHRPRKRAYKQTPSFNSFPEMKGPSKPMNFYGYKVGMVHLIAQSLHAGGRMDKQDMQIPSTIIECPPIHVWGVRAYREDAYGTHVVNEITVDKLEKNVQKKLKHFKKKSTHKKNATHSNTNKPVTFEDWEKTKETLSSIKLLIHTAPEKTAFGQKKAEVAELALSGTVEEQLAFAKSKFGQTLSVSEVFKDGHTVDVKAVTRGFGMGGVVARFGVKTFRPKAKYIRAVGSISPLNPKTVQFSVARPGQLGYHNRTEFNKKILKI